jgi:putative transposase
MTDEMMKPARARGDDPDADLLREMIGFAAERLMELEVGALTGAGYGPMMNCRDLVRTSDRLARIARPSTS